MALLLVKNRKALFDHSLVEKYTAGIVLEGYEVKAIKEGEANFEGSYVRILDGEPFVVNMYIGKYSAQSQPFEELRARESRKLLLNGKEIEEIYKELDQKGKTAVPLALILDNNRIKLEFAIVKGRKDYEKKAVAKEKQVLKDLERESKEVRKLVF